MIVSEQTAKGKKCCVEVGQVCRASGCMGWRWEVEPVEPDDVTERVEGLGWCGRAGEPPLRFGTPVETGLPDELQP